MLDTDPRKLRDRPRAVGFDVMHGVLVVRRTTPGRVVAELDGQGRAGDGDGQGLPGVGAAEGDLLPADHDDAGARGGGWRLSTVTIRNSRIVKGLRHCDRRRSP
jgi:hypothetical protein